MARRFVVLTSISPCSDKEGGGGGEFWVQEMRQIHKKQAKREKEDNAEGSIRKTCVFQMETKRFERDRSVME